MPRLAGKIAWITGAGSGIGEAAALALSDEGATVVLTSRRSEPLERLAARIQQQGGDAHVQPADLMNAKSVQKIGEYIQQTFGRLDILVNNAGLNIRDRHWDKLTPEGIDELVNGNLTQALYCVTVALPFMRAQNDGVLIHTSSMAGRFIGGFPGPLYTAESRAAVTRPYRCAACRAIHQVGPGAPYLKIADLQAAGCPACGATIFQPMSLQPRPKKKP